MQAASAQDTNVFEINKDREFDLLREIYVSLFANALVFKAGAITGLRYMGCSHRDLDALKLLEAAVMLLKMEPSLTQANAASLESFAEHVQAKVMDCVQSGAVAEPSGTIALFEEIAHCQQLATQECQYITGQLVDNDFLPFEFSELAKRAFVTPEPISLLSLHVQLSAARAFMLTATTLYTEILKGIQASESTPISACYQTYKSYVPLLFVANSFYEVIPETEVDSSDGQEQLENLSRPDSLSRTESLGSPECLDNFLDAMRFQFPVLNDESNEQDEHCTELLEQCMSDARDAAKRISLLEQTNANC